MMVQIRTPPKISKLPRCRENGESMVNKKGVTTSEDVHIMYFPGVPRRVSNAPHSRVAVRISEICGWYRHRVGALQFR